MELTYKQLKKLEIINIVEGKSLGFITDLTLSFPNGKLVGITAQGRKVCFLLRPFIKNELYIPVEKITKIGNDVILVNLKCGDECAPSVAVGTKPNCSNCPPPCTPTCNQLFSEDDL